MSTLILSPIDTVDDSVFLPLSIQMRLSRKQPIVNAISPKISILSPLR